MCHYSYANSARVKWHTSYMCHPLYANSVHVNWHTTYMCRFDTRTLFAYKWHIMCHISYANTVRVKTAHKWYAILREQCSRMINMAHYVLYSIRE